MPYLVISGTTVEVADDSVDREEVPVGEVRPAFSGAPLSSVRAYKRKWSCTTILLTRAAADTLEGLLQAAPPLTLTGDLTGAISGYAQNIRMHSKAMVGGAEKVRLSFELLEA